VHDAVVFVAANRSELIAALVSDAPGGLDEDALRAFLGERLPPYMIPARFSALPDFPRNANGKIDRRKVRETLDEPS
jgi:acyl-CoA synthetase (AMP-forming)/AMP-acid ligase II